MSNLKNKITEVLKDVKNLEIATFTGAGVTIDPEDIGQDDSQKIFSKCREAMAEATMVGYTRMEIEGDSVNFLASDADTSLVELHNEAVEVAQESRKGLFETIGSVFKGIFDLASPA